jgi:hypothetical protein
VRNDGRANVHVGAEPADVVVVLMRVHQEADGLVGHEAHDLVDHGEIAPLVERRLDDGDVLLELDRDAVV